MTLRERYGEARDIAGQTANRKAALALRAAKQSGALSNNSKMTQGILSSQAMNDAVSSGFDEGIDKGANMAAQVASEEAREKDREQNQKQFEASQAQQALEAEKQRDFQKSENKKDRKQGLINAAVGGLLKGLF